MKKIYILMLASIVATFFIGCSSTVEIDDNSVAMGAFLPYNAEPELSKEVANAMNLAVTEVNKNGGINGKKLVLVIKSDKKDSFDTGRELREFINNGDIKIFHLAFGNQIVQDHKFLNKQDDIFVNYMCRYPPATVVNKNSVRIFLNGAQECELMAKAIKEVQLEDGQELKIVLMSVDDYMGKSCGDYLKFQISGKDKKVFADVYPRGEKSFEVFAEQIERLNASYFFAYTYGLENQSILNDLGKYNFKGVFVANCPMYQTGNYMLPSGIKDYYQVMTEFSLGNIKSNISKSFKQKYFAAYKKEATWVAAYAYDSIILTSKAYKSGEAISSLRNFFSNKSFEGAIGTIKFDADGDSLSQLKLVRYK